MQDESDKNQVHLANRMRVGDHKQVETQTDTLHTHTWLVLPFLRPAGCLALKLIEKVAVGQDSIMRYK